MFVWSSDVSLRRIRQNDNKYYQIEQHYYLYFIILIIFRIFQFNFPSVLLRTTSTFKFPVSEILDLVMEISSPSCKNFEKMVKAQDIRYFNKPNWLMAGCLASVLDQKMKQGATIPCITPVINSSKKDLEGGKKQILVEN